ncbi:MAG: ribose 5-phosphate isomerase B [Nitrospirae bacterium GWC2_57_13]|jgi:RpiB/LacA/LacB family sugar-phosphate isomerase|nr:MAG: ribose 5-phosphate isomerase B [Nitrospirae bacterium GWC2_57_13]
MRIAIGADHGGFHLKTEIADFLKKSGHDVADLGAHSEEPSDYPDFARAVAKTLRAGKADRGILICGSGVGASVAANKFHGIRAAVCHDTFSARQGVEDDDMNVLCLGARIIGPELARELVRTFLAALFSGEERHRRRLAKVAAIEQEQR